MIPLNKNLSRMELSGIRKYTNLARQTPGCVMLTLGEPDFDTPAPIRQAAMAALSQGQTHYAPNQGLPELRQAIARYESSRGCSCDAAQVLVTAGATGALFTCLLGILNPGDQVVVPTPAFPLYRSIITAAGGEMVCLDTAKAGFQLTAQALTSVITPKTKAIILNSPNNPTGTVYTQASLEAVKTAVLGKPIYVLCDNVYNQLCQGICPDLSLDPDLKQQLFLCQSFSKPYAMTGWRIGYLIGPEAVMERLLLLHAAQVAAIPTFLQYACITALQTDVSGMLQSYEKRRDYVCRRLRDMGLSFPEPEGAFYIFADISPFSLDSDTFCTRLIQQGGVAVVPGSCFEAEGYIRISCCCSESALATGMDRLRDFIETL